MFDVKPYISFLGNCEEAMNFYKEKLNAEILFMGRFGDSPMAGKGPDDKILHCSLKIGNDVIMACDAASEGCGPVTLGNNISIALGCQDVEEAERAFKNLSEGATIVMPMQETFWAKRFGMLKDKFGINWMFNCDKPH